VLAGLNRRISRESGVEALSDLDTIRNLTGAVNT